MFSTGGHMPSASGPPTKTPARTLIRVRNNQRRHRERRRQYIASLEQKTQETERRLTQALADVATLKAELERLQSRNNKDSTKDSNDSPYLKATPVAGKGNFEIRETFRIAQESDSYASGTSPASQRLSASGPTIDNSPTAEPYNNQVVLRPEQLDALALMHPEASDDYYQALFPPRCCSVVEEVQNVTNSLSSNTMPTSSTSESEDPIFSPSFGSDYPPPSGESTTPCLQAYTIISQLNFRGLDTGSITSWLHRGFRRPTLSNKGCQVESKLLFELLDFISDA